MPRSYEVAIKNTVRGRAGKRHFHLFPLISFRSVPLTPRLLAGSLVLILAHNQFILITMGSVEGGKGGGVLIDWQVFAYTVCNKMSRPALVVTCVGGWQNKLMRVIYHAACALLSRGCRTHCC